MKKKALTYLFLGLSLFSCKKNSFPEMEGVTINKIEISAVNIQNIYSKQIEVSCLFKNIQLFDAYGFCYNTNNNPTINNKVLLVETLNNNSEADITIDSLKPNTKYFIRALVMIKNEIIYGEVEQVSTLPPNITINFESISEIKKHSAILTANVKNDDGINIIERGFCWNIQTNASVNDNKKIIGGQLGLYSSLIDGLNSSTRYYVRAYLINEYGIVYSSEDSFSTKTK